MNEPSLFQSNLESRELLHRGKVRDIYAVDAQRLLFVASDRLSAFDVVLDDPIPGKGRVLTELSTFWFHRLAPIIPSHITGEDPANILAGAELDSVRGRALVVRRLTPLPVEAIVRGYLAGSGWKDYQSGGRVSGIALPAGMELAQRLPEPLFTPSTKAQHGLHDENINFEQMVAQVGAEVAANVRSASLEIYEQARSYAASRGIIIADTKFEFGLDVDGKLILIDEALTPDSSRFWPALQYRVGVSPPSYDKQFVRDYLESVAWNKTPPAPRLPARIIEQTAAKYREAQRVLTGT